MPAWRAIRAIRTAAARSSALVVEDSWQGRGLGQALLDALEPARAAVASLRSIGYVLRENHDMRHLMRARGYRGEREAARGRGVSLRADLAGRRDEPTR